MNPSLQGTVGNNFFAYILILFILIAIIGFVCWWNKEVRLMNTGSTFAIILVLFILLVIVGYGGWFTGNGF